jgi:hypothetical protein
MLCEGSVPHDYQKQNGFVVRFYIAAFQIEETLNI